MRSGLQLAAVESLGRNIRICHIISGLNNGGAETVLCQLIEALCPPTFEHAVVVLGSRGAMSPRVEKFALLRHLDMRPGRFTLSSLLRLRRWLRDYQPDVIHGWMYHADLMGTLASWGMGVPVIWAVHQSLYGLQREKFTTRIVISTCSLLSRLPSRIQYVSATSATQHSAFGFSSERAILIPNGFDIDKFAPDVTTRSRLRRELNIPPDAIAIGLVARIHPMKDHANFLHAAAYFVKRCPQSVFVLVGDGAVQQNQQLTAMVEELDLSSHVRLCGRRADIPAVDNALDIVSSSSSWGEAFPMSLGEAMACGKPCVATDIGDVQQIIGDTGIVVPPRDPAALSEGWSKIVALGPQGRYTLGVCARQRIVDHYSLAANSAQYAELYRSLASPGEAAVMDFPEAGK